MWALSTKVNPAHDLIQLPHMSVLSLDPSSMPAGITDKLIIDATTPVAPDQRGHFHQPVNDLTQMPDWLTKLTRLFEQQKKQQQEGS